MQAGGFEPQPSKAVDGQPIDELMKTRRIAHDVGADAAGDERGCAWLRTHAMATAIVHGTEGGEIKLRFG